MACSPEDVEPVLDFEAEERMILEACSKERNDIELLVEESGSLEGLTEQVISFNEGYFDVFHMTGHAGIDGKKPVFLMEDDFGYKKLASAADIARAFRGNWPRLIFLSGCQTGQAVDDGLPSLCEELVGEGAPAVLGWSLPVGDKVAAQVAAELYQHLSSGIRVDEAVARARQKLLEEEAKGDSEEKSVFWHLLCLYTNATPLSEILTR